MKNEATTVVVTRASAGIGRAVATAYGARGTTVGLIARGKAGLAATADDVERAGGRVVILPLDVAEPEAVFAIVGRLRSLDTRPYPAPAGFLWRGASR